MTLFFSILAGSVLVAVLLWKLGQSKVEARDPYGILWLIASALWVMLGTAQIHKAWTALSDVVAVLLSSAPTELAAQAAKIDDARFHLIVSTLGTVFWAIHLVRAIRKTRIALESRTAERAKSQETHA